jgi:chorismate synthase
MGVKATFIYERSNRGLIITYASPLLISNLGCLSFREGRFFRFSLYLWKNMAGNTFGTLFRLTTFGESHGIALGGVIDGCPAGLLIDFEFIASELRKRRPGQSHLVSQRKEEDEVEFLSGLVDGKTSGAPIGFLVKNVDAKSKDYDSFKNIYRPSHADYTYDTKYGIREHNGGGRASARETVCRVVGGAIAKQLLQQTGVTIQAYISQVGDIQIEKHYSELDLDNTYSNAVHCPDEQTAALMQEKIEKVKKEGDTIGGTISCIIKGTAAGWGEPVFDKLNADLAKATLSINAAKGFEYGSGFEGIKMKGSEHNDAFTMKGNKIGTSSNYSGGIQGGITNGEDIYFKVAFKPVSTIMKKQITLDNAGKEVEFTGKGRHDPCVLPRATVIVEAMAALVLADHFLRNKTAKLS